ncbi:hypothetical protein [Clostridium sp. J1101437_171009_A5]|uniref:hypothetical protein n=1 Tax=Eubacteriales TaxID=186802 RepID=UPI00189B173F|nr:hypothetical protein [Clostridium sp. J1101437_171009_A5]
MERRAAVGGGVCTDGKIGDKSAEEERENSEMGQQENGNSILQKLDTVFVQLQLKLKLKKRALAQFDKKRYTVFIR